MPKRRASSSFTLCWLVKVRTLWCILLIAVFAFCATARTAAQEPTTSAPPCDAIRPPGGLANSDAAKLIADGNEKFKYAQFREAAKIYLSASKADGDPVALYNLGVSLVQLDQQHLGNQYCARAAYAMGTFIGPRPSTTLTDAEYKNIEQLIAPTQSPTATPTPSPTATPTPSPTATPTPSPTATPTPSPTATPSPSPTATPSPSPTPGGWQGGGFSELTPYLLGAGGAAALITTIYYLRSRRRRSSMSVQIDTPDDLIIQACHRAVTFTAHTVPPGRESEIRWDVPLDQFQTTVSGGGPTFSTSWTETGLKQVVAKIGNAADDVILLVYKTTSGRATLGDILESTPPPVSRRPSDYRRYRRHQFPSGLEN